MSPPLAACARLSLCILGMLLALLLALVGGALLSYPLHLMLGGDEGLRFDKLMRYATLLVALLAAVAWIHAGGQGRTLFGLQRAGAPARLAFGVALGLGCMLGLYALLLGLGLYRVNAEFSWARLAELALKGLLSGVAVALLEESLFRGALLGALLHHAGGFAAAVLASAFFAMLHFLDFPRLEAGTPIAWSTGLAALPHVLAPLLAPGKWLEAGSTLFMLGALLAALRLRHGDLLACLGLHGAIVACHRPLRHLVELTPEAAASPWLDAGKAPLGLLATAWLTLILLAYLYRQRSATRRNEAK